MKKILAILATAAVMVSCNKSSQGCKNVDPKDEAAQLQAYATQNGFTVTAHSSGIYYQVITQGTGATPNVNSKVYVTYTGKRLDGTVFDSLTDPSKSGWALGGLIEGWKIGIPLIQKGGHIRLLIPSALAYGCAGAAGAIASNTPLFFDINLIDVQ